MELQIKGPRPLRVFIGYDSREPDAWEVCAASLRRHSSIPLAINALKQDRLRARGLYTREPDERASTEFSLTRFLVPHLSDYEGFSLFVDCDFLFTRDIAELWPRCDRNAAVNVVKHQYAPKNSIKMDGAFQHAYPCKNWSSLMVFNNARCRMLSVEMVNRMPPEYLHRFMWVDNFGEDINELPREWNFLVGEYDPPGDGSLPAAIHYTNGGPWFEGHENCAFADQWLYALYQLRGEQENRK